jgi:hypothetical protein
VDSLFVYNAKIVFNAARFAENPGVMQMMLTHGYVMATPIQYLVLPASVSVILSSHIVVRSLLGVQVAQLSLA